MANATVKVLGIIFVILGIIGLFIHFDGLFSLTVTHNLVHLITGIIMLIVSGTEARSATTAKVFGIIYAIVFIVGLFKQHLLAINLFPADDVLHVIIAIVLLYVGFKTTRVTTSSTKHTTM